MEVFFDDFSVHLTGTDIVQKDDYYPFGGSFNAYTDLSTPQQDYLYNGVRLNKTTQLYETAFRTYDPYLGRFNHIDPLTAMVPGLSPYHFGFNNPVRYSDPMGLMGDDAGIWGTGNTYASTHSQNPFDLSPKFTQTSPGSGNHWSDEIGNSDWSMWGGSDSYRKDKAFAKSIGGYGYGSSFFDGNGNEIGFVNGKYQVWYPRGRDLAYSVAYEKDGKAHVDLHYYGAWGDPIGGRIGEIDQEFGFLSKETFQWQELANWRRIGVEGVSIGRSVIGRDGEYKSVAFEMEVGMPIYYKNLRGENTKMTFEEAQGAAALAAQRAAFTVTKMNSLWTSNYSENVKRAFKQQYTILLNAIINSNKAIINIELGVC